MVDLGASWQRKVLCTFFSCSFQTHSVLSSTPCDSNYILIQWQLWKNKTISHHQVFDTWRQRTGSFLCVTGTEERSVIHHVVQDFPLSNLLRRLAHSVAAFVWWGALKTAPQLVAANTLVCALCHTGERKGHISNGFGGRFNFCHLWRLGTNINSCLTCEKLIRWLINYVCGKKKIYQWVVWGFRSVFKLITKGILWSRSRLGWAFVLPLCLKMVNTQLFLCNSLVGRERVISMEFIPMGLSAVWKHRRQLTNL